VEQAWPLLLNVADIARCVPGGELLDRLDDRSFKGRVTVKLGPILLTFEGIAKFTEIDSAAHRARVEAIGTDKKGRGTAQAAVTMQVVPIGSTSKVTVVTDLQLSGAVAQYGRASGLIAEVSQQLVNEFAENLNQLIGEPDVAGNAASENISATQPSRPAVKPISGFRLASLIFRKACERFLKTIQS
jgi:carbon monoxide dehydrogenase subunit G